MTRSIIFLDIDGVLNSFAWREQRPVDPDPKNIHGLRLGWKFIAEMSLDTQAVVLFDELVRKTQSAVVITSSKRIVNSLCAIASMLEHRGAAPGIPLVGSTPTYPGQRGDQISWWVRTMGIESYVIFDDDSDMDAVRDRFVHVDGRVGLTAEDCTKAQEILKRRSSE